jgi:hypothetical protein
VDGYNQVDNLIEGMPGGSAGRVHLVMPVVVVTIIMLVVVVVVTGGLGGIGWRVEG